MTLARAQAQVGLCRNLADLDGDNAKLFMAELCYSGTAGDLNYDGYDDPVTAAHAEGQLTSPADDSPGTICAVFGGPDDPALPGCQVDADVDDDGDMDPDD